MSSNSDVIEHLPGTYYNYMPVRPYPYGYLYPYYYYWTPYYWWSWWNGYPYELFDGQDNGGGGLSCLICLFIIILLCLSSSGFIR